MTSADEAPAHRPVSNPHGQLVGPIVSAELPRPRPDGRPLRGAYVESHRLRAEHAAELFAALCATEDEPLWTYRQTARPISIEQLTSDVLAPMIARETSVAYVFFPEGRGGEGMAVLHPIVPEYGVVEISNVIFARPMQRTRAATEAIHLLLAEVFALGYRRVEWKCDSLNEPSRRAALRLGFTEEGRFRQHLVTKGRSRDTDWFSIIDTEWPAIDRRQRRWLDASNFDADGQQLLPLSRH